ncbi:hypothetical protein GQ457_15G009960 [Hibiscus cannabinus]
MVSEVPIVRVAADVSSSSSSSSSLGVGASKPFTNKSISIRLDETNYLLWRQQVLFTIESLDLSSHIDGTSVVPSQYVLVNSEKVPNPQYGSFKQHDNALCSWLLASISLSILPSLVSCRTAFEIWEKVQQIFSVSSTTKIMHLHCSLKNLRKRDQGMREYLAQIQSVCDSLAACGNPLSETMHIFASFSGLPSDYEPVVAVITSSQQPYKLDGVCGVLLDIEARLQETHSVNLVQSSSLGYDGFHQFSSSNGPNVFVEQEYHPFVGQVSSSASATGSQRVFSESGSYPQRVFQDSSFSQRGFQGPTFFRGSGFQARRFFSRGCGGRVFSGRVRPQCQLCGRIGHLVNRCYYRFDRSYDGYYVNLVEEVLDYQKPEVESLNQDLSGIVALVSDDFSPVVCEDTTWFLDSGATAHLTPDLGKFHSSLPYTGSGKIIVANGMAVPISRVGNSSLSTNSRPLFLSNLLHVMLHGSESNGLYKFLSKHDNRVHQVAESCDNRVHQVFVSLAHTDSSDNSSNSVDSISSSCNEAAASVCSVSVSDICSNNSKIDCSQIVENFRLPKLSLVSKSGNNQPVQFDHMFGANQLPASQLSASKFPAKLLVYQRRPKPTIQSVLLPNQQANICLHRESSACLSQVSNFQDDVLANVQEHSAGNSNIPGDVLANNQEHPLTTSKSSLFSVSQESQVSINSSSVGFQGLPISANTSTSSSQKQLQYVSSFLTESGNAGDQNSSASLVSGLRMGCHPVLTRSKTGSLKNKVCFSAVTTMEVPEPKTVKQAFESKEDLGFGQAAI